MLLVAESFPNHFYIPLGPSPLAHSLYLKNNFSDNFQISEISSSLAFSPSRIGSGKEKLEGRKQITERASDSLATITTVIRSYWGHVKPL